MKKFNLLVLGLSSLLLLGSCGGKNNDKDNLNHLENKNFEYNIQYNKVNITKYKGNDNKVIIPSIINGKEVTTISKDAFKNCSNIEEIVVSDGVKTLNRCFNSLPNLKKVHLADSVESMIDAVNGCNSFDGYYINDLTSFMNINITSYSDKNLYNLYLNDKLVENLIIPTTITEVKENSFNNCKSIKSIKLHDNIKKVGSSFNDTPNLKSIYVDDLVSWCNIDFREGLINGRDFYVNNDLIEELVVPEITEVKDNTFNNANFKKITIPSTVKNIGDYSFANCKNLKTVDLKEGITNIGNGSFAQCVALEDIKLANSIVSIGDNAFSNNNFSSLTLPNSLKEIGNNAFEGNKNLVSVKFKDGIETIKNNAFSACTKLDNVVLPNTVKNLGNSTFYNCSSLKNIQLSSSLTTLPSRVLDGTAIESFVIPSNIKNFGIYPLGNSIKKLYIPYEIEEIKNPITKGNPELIVYCERPEGYAGYMEGFVEDSNKIIYGYEIR